MALLQACGNPALVVWPVTSSDISFFGFCHTVSALSQDQTPWQLVARPQDLLCVMLLPLGQQDQIFTWTDHLPVVSRSIVLLFLVTHNDPPSMTRHKHKTHWLLLHYSPHTRKLEECEKTVDHLQAHGLRSRVSTSSRGALREPTSPILVTVSPA